MRHVDVPLGVTGHDHDLHPRHDRARGIGAMGRRRDEDHGALALAARLVPGPNHQQSRQLALGPGVRLERNGRKARDLGEGRFQVAEDLAVALSLVERHEGMQAGELRPGDGQHLGCRVELHRA
jgi:hypothetical protein